MIEARWKASSPKIVLNRKNQKLVLWQQALHQRGAHQAERRAHPVDEADAKTGDGVGRIQGEKEAHLRGGGKRLSLRIK